MEHSNPLDQVCKLDISYRLSSKNTSLISFDFGQNFLETSMRSFIYIYSVSTWLVFKRRNGIPFFFRRKSADSRTSQLLVSYFWVQTHKCSHSVRYSKVQTRKCRQRLAIYKCKRKSAEISFITLDLNYAYICSPNTTYQFRNWTLASSKTQSDKN